MNMIIGIVPVPRCLPPFFPFEKILVNWITEHFPLFAAGFLLLINTALLCAVLTKILKMKGDKNA